MKTVPHVVLEKHLQMFHPMRVQSNSSRKPQQKKRAKPIKKKNRKVKAATKKPIKGRVTKKRCQSVARHKRSNIKDIFSS